MSSTSRMAERSPRRLPAVPASVSAARRAVREVLDEAGREDLRDDALLLVSELATNALLHAGTPMELTVELDEGGVTIGVRDGSLHLPVPRSYAATAGTGRGLRMLEQVSDAWGVRTHPDGKTVWFRLGAPAADEGGATGDEGPRTSPESVEVSLRNFPLLIHAAWQEHAAGLLRELLLASLDEPETDQDPIQVHAEATDALAVLEEHVPRLTVSVEPDELMRGATEPLVTLDHLVLPVPRRSVPSFATLDRAIDDAIALAMAGRALTPPTQPEVRSFRRWLCAQVAAQAAGSTPTRWPGGDQDHEEPVLGEVRDLDLEDLTGAPTARIVADETGRMVAVSTPAAQLLGYDAPGDLVGHRILQIIPARYRQAHVAGLSLFLLTGRRPLLGREVEVPALRRDGDEVLVSLRVEVENVGGTPVFVATFEPAGG